MLKVPESNRVLDGLMGSTASMGNNGAFKIKNKGFTFNVICTDAFGWEHVSVHIVVGKKKLTPTWDQMCFIKNLFWDEDDCVVQYHPAKSEYVNLHPNVLHLWRPTDQVIPIPPKIMVG